jgi:hypothetical protein
MITLTGRIWYVLGPLTDEAKRKFLARWLAEQEELLALANQKHDAQLKAR